MEIERMGTVTKLFNPTPETLFAIFEQAGWTKTKEKYWLIFTAPHTDDEEPFEYGFPSKFRDKQEEVHYCALMASTMDNLGLIELAKPDANGWYKVSEVELVDRQEYAVYDDLCNTVLVVRHRKADDYNDTAPTKGKPWWDMAYSTEVFPYKAFLYFQPLPTPPVGYPKKPDYLQSNIKKEKSNGN